MSKRGLGLFELPRLRGYDAFAVSQSLAVETGEESLVQQQFADEVDINTIVRRFGLTDSMPSGPAGGVYGDFTGIMDYDDAVEAIERARAGFMSMPAEVRERFRNDPGVYLDFVESNPELQDSDVFPVAEPPVSEPDVPAPG